MKTLFIDSSRKSLSVALASCNKLLFVSNVNSYSKHSNFLMNEIKSILIKSNINIYDIDNIVVLNGPGSFTGIRVGVTISKTLSWVLSKKLFQLNNLKALKAGIDDEIVICVIPDKEKQSYVGIYEKDKSIEDYLPLDSKILDFKHKKITLVSMEENKFVEQLKENLEVNNEVSLNYIDDYDYLKVIDLALSTGNINPHLAEPIYLKKIDVEKKSVN